MHVCLLVPRAQACCALDKRLDSQVFQRIVVADRCLPIVKTITTLFAFAAVPNAMPAFSKPNLFQIEEAFRSKLKTEGRKPTRPSTWATRMIKTMRGIKQGVRSTILQRVMESLRLADVSTLMSARSCQGEEQVLPLTDQHYLAHELATSLYLDHLASRQCEPLYAAKDLLLESSHEQMHPITHHALCANLPTHETEWATLASALLADGCLAIATDKPLAAMLLYISHGLQSECDEMSFCPEAFEVLMDLRSAARVVCIMPRTQSASLRTLHLHLLLCNAVASSCPQTACALALTLLCCLVLRSLIWLGCLPAHRPAVATLSATSKTSHRTSVTPLPHGVTLPLPRG